MNIGIQTWGSNGDIRPMIALADGLQQAGHRVTLIAGSIDSQSYRSLCQALNIDYQQVPEQISLDLRDFAQRSFEMNPLQWLKALLDEAFLPYEQQMYRAARQLADNNDVVIGHHFLYPLKLAAAKAGIPHISITLCHAVIPTPHQAPLRLPRLWPQLNRWQWRLFETIFDLALKERLGNLWSAEGMPRVNHVLSELLTSDYLNVVAVDPLFCPFRHHWPTIHQATGFLNLPMATEPWVMPETLQNFLAAGDRPVYMTFGSLQQALPEWSVKLFMAATERAGCRAIIQTSAADYPAGTYQDNCYFVGKHPHLKLFDRCAAVVHHGGAGTTQTTTLAGLPSVVVPFMDEQLFWAWQLHDLGLAPKPLPAKRINAKKLAESLRKTLDSAEMRKQAKGAREKIANTNGVNNAVKLIEETIKRPRTTPKPSILLTSEVFQSECKPDPEYNNGVTMGPHYLSRFFTPKTVAIIGASERPESVGHRILVNMQEAGFNGGLYPVNPKREQISGLKAYPDLDAIPEKIELAVIATPAATVPGIVRQCGEKGVDSIIIITAGFAELDTAGKHLQQEILDIAHRYGIRIIGPNCLGVVRPSGRLNATFGDGIVKDGNLALLSQSGAVCTAILDWAQSQEIGFSTVVSMGGAADVDFGEVLDYLALDSKTTGILMYVEGIRDARRFLSGLKAAARLKPVILIKSGRHESGCKAAMSHTGAMVGGDDVFDAAIARAGVVRAYSIAQLFSAARVLANNYVVKKNRLAIITNAGGPGVMSTDRAEEVGVEMAELSQETLDALNQILPPHWSHANPIDILGDATPERYQQALAICLQDNNIDGVLNILTPQAMTNPTQVAEYIIEASKSTQKPILASWTGGNRVQEGRDLFDNSQVAHFSTPEVAVDAFSFLAQYSQNQILLKQIPSSENELAPPDIDGARLIVERVLAENRQVLTTQESKAILAAFHIPVSQTIKVTSAKEAMIAAETMGFPVVLKINMAEFSHKSDIGGVRLNIGSAKEISHHYQEMAASIKQKHPDIQEVSMTVEPMYRSVSGRELMIGVIRDPVFGPAISVGLGGTMVEILNDKAVALPPLNEYMVEQMIAKTKAAKYLRAFRQLPAANKKALVKALLNVSSLVSELPEILELDINPLIVDARGVIAVDARIKAQLSHQLIPYSHMTIHPYPHELTHHYQLPNGIDICIRPIRPEDADIEKDFVRRLSDRSKYFRFMQALQELTPEMVIRFTQIDYDREMAFIAVTENEVLPRELGVGRYMMNPDGHSVEFALVVSDDCQGMGIGSRIMKTLMQAAKYKGVSFFEGEVLTINKPMLSLVKKLGFTVEPVAGDSEVVRVVKDLRA